MKDLMMVGATENSMTSLQIAEITGKQHKNVLADVRKLLEQGVGQLNFKQSSYRNSQNKEQPMFILTKKGCLILASGYDALLRERIINRWEELEKANMYGGFNIPTTLSGALMLAAKQAEMIEEKDRLLLDAKPKVEYFDNLVDRKLNVNFRDTAKELGLKQNAFISLLEEKGYIYRDKGGKIKPYANHVDNELFVLKEFASSHKSGVQTLITPKGRETFRIMLNK